MDTDRTAEQAEAMMVPLQDSLQACSVSRESSYLPAGLMVCLGIRG
jgi:hypothetical protein